jgi:hypothetical protein
MKSSASDIAEIAYRAETQYRLLAVISLRIPWVLLYQVATGYNSVVVERAAQGYK